MVQKINNISFWIIAALCALTPLIFLSSNIGSLLAVKGFIIYGGVFCSLALWLVGQFILGTFTVPKNPIIYAMGIWTVLSFIGALFSQNVSVSLWGRGFALDSFATVLVLSLFTFLIASFSRERQNLVTIFLATFLGSVATVLLQIILYVSQNTKFVATYFSNVANGGTLVGSWVDFSYFVTFTFLLSLLICEILKPKNFIKAVALFSLGLTTITMVFLNFSIAWIFAITSALFVFVYKTSVERMMSKNDPEKEQHFPLVSFLTLLVGLFFFLSSGNIGAYLSQKAGIVFNDVRPSFTITNQVIGSTIVHKPFFGVGAGRFADAWNLYHAGSINGTMFWNTQFDSGFSLIQTLMVTNGVIVALLFLFIFLLSIYYGFKLFTSNFPDVFSRFIIVTSLIITIVFTLLLLLGTPGFVLVAMGFLYLGILVGGSGLVGKTEFKSYEYLKDPRASFFTILALVVIIMASFTAVYFSGNRFASIVLYNRALSATSFENAQLRLDRAISLSQNDLYYRTRSALFVKQFSTEAQNKDADKAKLQEYYGQALASAQAAVAWDNTSVNNWLGLSQVYRLVASKDKADAADQALVAGQEALKRAPLNPLYTLNIAQSVLSKGDVDTGLIYVDQAIKIKPDYLDAFILKAQIKQANDDLSGAKDVMISYIKASPYDDQGYALLAEVNTGLKNYQDAIDALNQAIALNGQNPNYYVSITQLYKTMGQNDKAIAELQLLKKYFPNIQGIDAQITKFGQSDTSLTSPAPVVTPSLTPVAPKSKKK